MGKGSSAGSLPLGELGDGLEVHRTVGLEKEAMSEVSAYHEAGHAFMALFVGAKVHSVTIEPDWDDGPARYADAQILWPTNRWDSKTLGTKEVMVALAGPVVEMIHSEEPLHPGFVPEWAGDWTMAWEGAGRFVQDERKRLAFLEEITKRLHRFLKSEEAWNTIAAIVDELTAHETLEAEQIEEVYRTWMTAR